MKKLTLALLVLTSLNAKAAVTMKDCSDVEIAAGAVIDAYQSEIKMSKTMSLAKGNQMFTLMIKEAYAMPTWSIEVYRKKQRFEFANKWYSACIGLIPKK